MIHPIMAAFINEKVSNKHIKKLHDNFNELTKTKTHLTNSRYQLLFLSGRKQDFSTTQ